MQQPSSHKFSFGPFVLDPAEQALLRNGQPVHLAPKAFETLLTLVENDGHLVEKDELLRRVWPNTFVEEATLAQNIFVLRKALAKGSSGYEYIETVPKRGYRFVGPVEEMQVPAVPGSSIPATRRAARFPRFIAVGSALILLVAVVVWLAWMASRSAQFPSSSKIMLAVLPLENLSGDPSQDYFCDGLTEQLVADFGSLSPNRLGIIARTTMMQYRSTRKNVARIGNDLNVDYVLAGSVAREKQRVRIDAQLIRVQDQTNVWAHTYEREMGSSLALQNDVATAIVNAVALEVSSSFSAPKTARRTQEPAAYEAFLQGRYFWNKRSEQGYLKAIEYFGQAIRDDPGYAQAYSGLADAYALLGSNPNTAITRREAMEKARSIALKAITLDDTLAEAHASLAFVYWHYDWNWPAAEKEFRRALQLNPSYPTAHHWYAFYLLSQQKTDQALEEIRTAQRTDPLSLIINSDTAEMLLYAKRYDEAQAQAQRVLEMEPRFTLSRVVVAWDLLEKHEYEAAVHETEKAFELGPDPEAEVDLAITYAVVGRRDEARTILTKIRKQSLDLVPIGIAQGYASLGAKDEAFAALEKSMETRNGGLTLLKVIPFLESLHNDPRFTDLARRIGLPK